MNNKNKYSCNDSFEKARKKIEEANKNVKYRYIQGPTGPKGEQGETGPQGIQGLKGDQGETGPQGPQGENGPTTIEIGITETGDPGTESMVTNVGTNKDVILNFKIPRGEIGAIGPKGDTGPRGLPGEIGISEVITIDGTETIEPDELAEVQDDFDRNIHHLTFYIPKGEKGETGPQGPAGPTQIVSYAERYLDTAQEFNLQTEIDTIVPLTSTGPALFANYDTENAIDIKQTGFYQISYYFSATPKTNCNLTISVRDNDLLLPASNLNVNWQANTINNVSNSIITSLSSEDVLTLSIRSTTDTDLTFGEFANAVLSIAKIN